MEIILTFIRKSSFHSVVLLIFIFGQSLQMSRAQNTSVGGVYNPADKVLWLKAEDINLADGASVQNWPDASGKKNNAFAFLASHRPVFRASSALFNNRPVVSFNQGTSGQQLRIDHNPDNPNLDGMQNITVITVLRNSEPPAPNENQGIIGKSTNAPWGGNTWTLFLRRETNSNNQRLAFITNDQGQRIRNYEYFNTAMIHSAVFDGVKDSVFVLSNAKGQAWGPYGSSIRSNAAPVTIGNISAHASATSWFKGEIAEILVIREALNPAQRLILENVLAHKYRFPLQPVNTWNPLRYFLGDYENHTHSHDIIGIGGYQSDANYITSYTGYFKHIATTGGGGALYLSETANSIDQHNEFVFAGHNNLAHNVTTADMPTGGMNSDLVNRWTRVWRIRRTINQGVGTGTSVRIGFDFSEAGLQVDPQKLYVLLYRATETGTFTRLPVSAGVSGSRVTFSLPDNIFQTGFYTIAQTTSALKTWTSVRSGNWDNPATWGKADTYPGLIPMSDRADRIEINNTHIITLSEDNHFHGDLWIKAGGKLELNATRGHLFNTIRGEGTLQITGDYFPNGDASGFHKKNGGTTVYVGAGTTVFNTSRLFNNLIFQLDNVNDEITLLSNLTLNGNLFVETGTLRINHENATPRTIWVEGDFEIGPDGRVITGTGNARHRVTVRRNFINNGTARFSNLTQPNYSAPPINGLVDVVFNTVNQNQVIQTNGITEFYRIEIAKSPTDTLFIRANFANRFFLMGQNNIQQFGAYPMPPNLSNNNALGLLSGIIVLENNIHIPVLRTGNGNYFIDSDAQIILEGGILETPTNTWAISIYGALIIRDGLLRARGAEGLVLHGNGKFEVQGGNADLNIFRTSTAYDVNRGTFKQTGGNVLIDRTTPSDNHDYYLFSLPYSDNNFIMTGGTLSLRNVPSVTNRPGVSGGILIGAKKENQLVTGGSITAIISRDRDFIINSSAPLYNLEMVKEVAGTNRFLIADYPGGGISNNPPPFIAAKPLHILNRLVVKGGDFPSIFNINNFETIIEGTLLLENGAVLQASGSTITFAGSGNTRLEIENQTLQLEVGNLKIDKNAHTDTLRVFRSNLAGNTDLLNLNALTAQRGTLNFLHYNINLTGNLLLDSRIGTNPAQGKVVMKGTAEQTITVSTPASESYISHLEIDNPSGVKLLTGSIKGVTNLTLTNGVFNLGEQGMVVDNTIAGNGFNNTKMIATAGNHSNHGLTRRVAQNGSMLFPIGTTANNQPRYTPLLANFSNVNQPVTVQVNPVDLELSTLAGNQPDSALTYYWRVRHGQTNQPPTVTSYTFTYSNSNLPSPLPNGFVPGKIVNRVRSNEPAGNINTTNRTLLFNNSGSGFTLEEGLYTAAHIDRFSGAVRVFYSRLSGPASWHNLNTWTEDPTHTGGPASDLPGPGDLVQIGYSGSTSHSVRINTEVAVAGLLFHQIGEMVPTLVINAGDYDVNLGLVSGQGELIRELSANVASLSGDFTDFLLGQKSEIHFRAGGGTFNVPTDFSTYPGLRFSSQSDDAIFNLPSLNLTVRRNLVAGRNSDVRLNQNINVQGDLIIGTNQDKGIVLFPQTSAPISVVINGNVFLNGNNNSLLGVLTTGNNLTHTLRVGGNILQLAGTLRLFNTITTPRVNLELTGNNNNSYERTGGNVPNFFRIIVNKGNSQAPIFTFLHNFNIHNEAGGPLKPLELINGTLRLQGAGTDINLTTGNFNFQIPATTGLILASNVIVRANATNAGINLNGLLRFEGNSRLSMATTPDSRAFIQYGSTGTARLEITGSSVLEVANKIRTELTNELGVLKYFQDGGTVSLSINDVGSTADLKGVLEVYNPGSSFRFLSGVITFNRYMADAGHGHRETLYLDTSEYEVGENATINLGIPSINVNHNFRVRSTIELPNVVLGNGASSIFISNPTVIKGNLFINGRTLDVSNINLILLKGITNNGALNAGNSNVIMRGADQFIRSNHGNTEFHRLTIESTGQVNIENTIKVKNDLIINSGILNDGGKDINVEGNVVNNATHLSIANTGGIVLNAGGAVVQEISGTGSFGRLSMQNINGILARSTLTVNDMLRITTGNLNMSRNLLILGPNIQLEGTFSGTSMIRSDGSLIAEGVRWNIGSNSRSLTIPLGANNKYTPVQIIVDENYAGSFIQVSPVNQKHPNIVQSGNLKYYWKVQSNNLSGFKGQLRFTYNQDDVEPIEDNYIPGRLWSTSWSKLNPGLVNKTTNIITYPFNEGVDNIAGDYTAGSNIPDEVLRFRTISGGNWNQPEIWENITPGFNPADVPAGGPFGQIVEIAPGHIVQTGTIQRIAYQTTINGGLIANFVPQRHYLGNVGGTGSLATAEAALPIGEYSSFSFGGTLEYTGNTDYTIDPGVFPSNGFNNVIFSGTGLRRLPAGEVRVNGNLELKDAVVVDLHLFGSQLRLKGDLIQSGTARLSMGVTTTQSSITLDGNSPQRIIGNFKGTGNIADLRINNGAGIRLEGELEIRNALRFINGRINTRSPNTWLRVLLGGIISGSSATSYVDGPLQRQGNTTFVFPVGHNGRFARIAFIPSTLNPPSSQTIIEAQYFFGTTPNNTSVANPSELAVVSASEYWSIKPVLITKSGNVNGSVELYFENAEQSGIYIPESISVSRYNGAAWVRQGGTFINPNRIGSSEFNLALLNGFFTFGVGPAGVGNNPLPIELISFTARKESHQVVLEWTTATEINNDYFSIERSANGVDFYVIGHLNGSGNSNRLINYSYIDISPLSGNNYYRLKQTDYDGTFSYSEIVVVNHHEEFLLTINIFPNPVKDGILNIGLTGFDIGQEYEINLIELSGRVVKSEKYSACEDGYMNHSFYDMNNFKKGIYLLVIQSKNLRITEKVVIN